MVLRNSALALWLSCVLAAASGVAYHPSYEAAVDAAKAKGRKVMVLLVAPSRDAQGRDLCAMMRGESLADARVAALVGEHFCAAVYDLAELQKSRRRLPRPVQAALKPGAPVTVPMLLFLDPDGKLVNRIEGYADADQLLPQLRKAAGVQEPAAEPERPKEPGRLVWEDGRSPEDYDDLRVAMEALDAALGGMAGGTEEGTAGDDPEDKAMKAFEQGRSFERIEKMGMAIRAYSDCVRQYPKTAAARKAKKRLAELRDHPVIRKQYRDYRARKLIAQAETAMEKHDYPTAARAVDTILKELADTASAPAARKLAAQMDADPAIQRRLRSQEADKDARRLLALARSYQLNRRREKAIALYEKVIRQYPDTSHAEAAKAALAELRK